MSKLASKKTRPTKTTNINSVCLNAFNDYFFHEFMKLAKDANDKNNWNLNLIYKKVANSIKKYPFPIVNSSQTLLLEGVGETTSKIFDKLLNSYKEKIEKEDIKYVDLAMTTNQNFNFKKNGKKRKALTDTESDTKKNILECKSDIKKRKNLVNIEMYSSVWSSVVCAYILFLQSDKVILDFDDIIAMSTTLTCELNSIRSIQSCEGVKDFREMKNLNLLENVDLKEKKIKITDFLKRLAMIELKKSGILIEHDGNGGLNFTITEENLNEGRYLFEIFRSQLYG
jgi:hypothetical protein